MKTSLLALLGAEAGAVPPSIMGRPRARRPALRSALLPCAARLVPCSSQLIHVQPGLCLASTYDDGDKKTLQEFKAEIYLPN